MKQYFLTFKTLKEQNPTPMMYYKALEYLCKNTVKLVPDATRSAFELDSERKLHFHVVVYASYVRFKPLVEHFFKNDMYFHFVEIQEGHMPIIEGYLKKHRMSYPDAYANIRCAEMIESSPYPFIDEKV